MKKLIYFLVFVFSNFISSQEIQVSGTKQAWAGGICCASGTNYVLNITFSENDSAFDYDLISITYDGYLFTKEDFELSKFDKKVQITFGVHRNQNVQTIEKEKFVYDANLPNELVFKKGLKEEKIPITNVKELFYLAYP